MKRPSPLPPASEDLPQLYLRLQARLERMEGYVQQVLAERSRETSPLRPTWRDLQQLQLQVDELRRSIEGRDV